MQLLDWHLPEVPCASYSPFGSVRLALSLAPVQTLPSPRMDRDGSIVQRETSASVAVVAAAVMGLPARDAAYSAGSGGPRLSAARGLRSAPFPLVTDGDQLRGVGLSIHPCAKLSRALRPSFGIWNL